MASTQLVAIEDLKSLALFSPLSEDELKSIAKILEPVTFKAGKFVIRERDDSNDMFIIQRGKLKVCRADKDGKEVTISILGAGSVVGEISLLTDSKRSADVVALATTSAWCCTRADFITHAARYSGLLYQLLILMANRVRLAGQRITDLALYDVTFRVARVLLEMSILTEQGGVEVHVINDKPTHQILASMVGSSREAVTRALHVLEDEGHIEVDDERIWLYSVP